MPTIIEKAAVTLPSDSEVEVRRSFRAPRELVYRAYTEPGLTRRWMLGPPRWTMPVCDMDVRVGGRYTWRWRNESENQEFGFSGTYRELDPPSRIVHTEAFDPGTIGGPYPTDGEAVITTTFEEEGGVTTVTTRMDFGSKEARDGAMATGMTDGMEQSYGLLDGLLAEKAA